MFRFPLIKYNLSVSVIIVVQRFSRVNLFTRFKLLKLFTPLKQPKLLRLPLLNHSIPNSLALSLTSSITLSRPLAS